MVYLKGRAVSYRSVGWVQNPSDFNKLKLVVQVFDSQSLQYKKLRDDLVPRLIPIDSIRNSLSAKLNNGVEVFTYLELIGSQKDKYGKHTNKRSEAVADGLIQLTVKPQSQNTKQKEWTDNWTSNGFLSWAIALGFVQYDRDSDTCSITELGKQYSKSQNDSQDEQDILKDAIMAYPPATRVLEVLANASSLSKFQIGEQLGFSGEKGFTSYQHNLMTAWLIDAFNTGDSHEVKKIKSDIEGTSDKYARMIAGWLMRIGYIDKATDEIINTAKGQLKGFVRYKITGPGQHALRQSKGSSKNVIKPKFVMWEFLATATSNSDLVRTRRAFILKELERTNSLNMLYSNMAEHGFDDRAMIDFDISGLNNIGIRISRNGNTIKLLDRLVDFNVPNLELTPEMKNEAAEMRKADIMSKTKLPYKYYELMDIAYDKKRNRDFEILTVDLFTSVYKFKGCLMGGSRKPDGVIFTDEYGVIIDTKAYGKGYSKDIGQEDEMVRYIEDNQYRDKKRNPTEWWNAFNDPKLINFYFLWVSSFFTGQFSSQLKSVSARTKTSGSAINVEQLLIGADLVSNHRATLKDFEDKLNNSEITW